MRCYVCEIISGNLHLIEHEAARWLTADQLYSVAWLPADITLIPKIVRYIVMKNSLNRASIFNNKVTFV